MSGGRLEFRISGAEGQRLRRRLREANRARWEWARLVLGAIAVVWIGGGLSGPGSGFGFAPGAADGLRRDPGAVVRGDRVLILADRSGSMDERDGALIRMRDDQIASLRRRHDLVEATVLTDGWAMGARGASLNMVAPLETALARQSDVDAVYFISDFAQTDDRFSSADGRELLRRLLSARGIRLYVASVNRPVPPAWVEMAEQSGGSVIVQGAEFYRG